MMSVWKKLESDFYENNNWIVFKIICLIMNWIVCCELSSIEEIIWYFDWFLI